MRWMASSNFRYMYIWSVVKWDRCIWSYQNFLFLVFSFHYFFYPSFFVARQTKQLWKLGQFAINPINAISESNFVTWKKVRHVWLVFVLLSSNDKTYALYCAPLCNLILHPFRISSLIDAFVPDHFFSGIESILKQIRFSFLFDLISW